MSTKRQRTTRTLARLSTTDSVKSPTHVYPPRPLRLPQDVWLIIMDHLELVEVMKTSRVCRHLYNLVLSRSSLWRKLAISSTKWRTYGSIVRVEDVKRVLRRSADQPLTVQVTVNDLCSRGVRNALSGAASRVQEFTMTYKSAAMLKSCGLLHGTAMPRLEVVKLIYLPNYDPSGDAHVANQVDIEAVIPRETTPSLSRLWIPHHIAWDRVSAPGLFPCLVYLNISIRCTDVLAAVFDACPALTSLHVIVCAFLDPAVVDFAPPHLAAVQRLREITISGEYELDELLDDNSARSLLGLFDLSAPHQYFRIICRSALTWARALFNTSFGMTSYRKETKYEECAYRTCQITVTAENKSHQVRELLFRAYGRLGEDEIPAKQLFTTIMDELKVLPQET